MSDPESTSVCAIVLAAGGSRRFGGPKQIAQLDGESLVLRAVRAASAAVGPNLRVVLGACAAEIAATLDLPSDQMVVNADWAEGMASSIRVGIAHVPARCAAALILLADQPHVSGASLARLIAAWGSDPERVIASRNGPVTGAPCLFPRVYFSELQQLEGDRGAQELLRKHAAWVLPVDHPEAAIDIDTPQQLAEQQLLPSRSR